MRMGRTEPLINVTDLELISQEKINNWGILKSFKLDLELFSMCKTKVGSFNVSEKSIILTKS